MVQRNLILRSGKWKNMIKLTKYPRHSRAQDLHRGSGQRRQDDDPLPVFDERGKVLYSDVQKPVPEGCVSTFSVHATFDHKYTQYVGLWDMRYRTISNFGKFGGTVDINIPRSMGQSFN